MDRAQVTGQLTKTSWFNKPLNLRQLSEIRGPILCRREPLAVPCDTEKPAEQSKTSQTGPTCEIINREDSPSPKKKRTSDQDQVEAMVTIPKTEWERLKEVDHKVRLIEVLSGPRLNQTDFKGQDSSMETDGDTTSADDNQPGSGTKASSQKEKMCPPKLHQGASKTRPVPLTRNFSKKHNILP